VRWGASRGFAADGHQAGVETGLGILDELPKVATHDVFLLRSPSSHTSPAVDALEKAIAEQFRL